LTVGFKADAYEMKDDYPMPDFTAPQKEYNYRKLWGTQYKKGVHSLNWNPSKGWRGLVPGKPTLDDAFAVLGQPDVCYTVNMYQYCFPGVDVWTLRESKIIEYIEVFPTPKYMADFPLTMHDAKIMYGPIERHLKLEGDVTSTNLGRPGLTIEIRPEGENDEQYRSSTFMVHTRAGWLSRIHSRRPGALGFD
jgi:hypothetical protein